MFMSVAASLPGNPCSCLLCKCQCSLLAFAVTSLTESRAAFVTRAKEVGLGDPDVTALTGAGIDSLAKLAFGAVPPGTHASDAQVTNLYGAHRVNPGICCH